MTLLHHVVATLARAGVRHAVIGAAAMGVRGVGQSTLRSAPDRPRTGPPFRGADC